MHGNEALVDRFGQCVGLPAREGGVLVLPPMAFALMDAGARQAARDVDPIR
jgi:hypothetical protein